MFYTLFDLIEFYRQREKQNETDMYRFFLNHGVPKSDLDFMKSNCSVASLKGVMPAVSEYTGLSDLEIMLSLGIIPEEYKASFFNHVKDVSSLLSQEEHKQKAKTLTPFLKTELGLLYHADCLDLLSTLTDESVDMVFADPPFNLKKEYDTGIQDDLSMSEYVSWSYKWIDECIRILKPGGSLFIYNIPKWGTYYADFLNKRLTLRSWIGVNMKFSLPLAGRLYPAHYSLLYYIKGEKPAVYHNPRMPAETCRHCGGELHDYGGYKAKMNPHGVNVSDIWSDIYPVRHKNTKNRSYNELSIKMLDRIITMCTEPGDVVFDPFGGSGTTYIVAEMLERKWIGSELGNCDIIKDRFLGIDKDRQILKQVYEEKDVIFPEKVRKLRIKNGFWLSEDFKK